MTIRRLKMGLNTILDVKKEGYFIPYRYAETTPTLPSQEPYKGLFPLFQKREGVFADCLRQIAGYQEEFDTFGTQSPPEPRWEQDWFPRLDGAAAYTMVRSHKPKRIIEVGSGHSTRFMYRAIRDEGLNTTLSAIDPAPRADITKLPVKIDNRIVQETDLDIFSALEANDILFIDSSHIAMPGTDVDYLFTNVLPTLPEGTIVHIHDIFLPDAYPAEWEWRGYNEQQAVVGFLSGGYDILFSSHYASKYMTDEISSQGLDNIPLQEGAFETSLWLQKKS
ncbi:class I SAM-dependent methyltransferase [Sneathiella sp. P13V-1]|uniref:class I SAM-dependent methyltransferase n=1 Tax=Sneathiella sp. P13V-1 TaxID=2697366 RepID=UPI00187B49E9|nr:class I SAM-dependent methyltransferase [Sneathiella sp. P13V-1]MBE7635818.1 class I SAM-dependent methyltransferase [Sneathiella sp. P13V-1]